jgi:hypothetical protein
LENDDLLRQAIEAAGAGLGLSAAEILKLYVEQGPAIFGQENSAVKN